MSEPIIETYDQDALMQFLAQPEALGKLACLTQSLCVDGIESSKGQSEELSYVADQIINMAKKINLNPEKIAEVDAEISEYMNENGQLASNANYVIANARDLNALPLYEMSTQFQDVMMQLQALTENGQGEMAKAIMFLGVGIAKVEWEERKNNPGIPYDPEEHGVINFSTPKTPDEV